MRRFGHDAELLDARAGPGRGRTRRLYLGGLWTKTGSALVHPGKLADGLRAAAARAGVRDLRVQPGPRARQDGGRRVGQHRRRGRQRPPSPAGDERLPAAGARDRPVHRAGVRLRARDRAARRAHARRDRVVAGARGSATSATSSTTTGRRADGRILWGGYDAVYRYGGPVGPQLDDHEPTFAKLSQHFFTTFPQLEGLRFSHRWGGAIDTCSRFSVFFGTALGGRVAVRARLHRASASARAGSAAGSGSTCSTAARARRPRSRSCAGARCRSRPSRFAPA